MKEYRVIEDYILKDFIDKVNEALKNGWELQGGIAVSSRDSGGIGSYVQAMMRKSI